MRRHHFMAAVGSALVALQTRAGVAANDSAAMSTHGADEAYDLQTPSGVISGSLRVPAEAAHPAVVAIIAGSGPTDRNGNAATVRPDAYRLLADALETRGIATLRYDKRGVGASVVVAEADLRFETYVDDAVAWIAKLRADRRFGRVIVAGHSEGSLIGMLVAQRTRLDGYVSLCGAGEKAADVLRQQLGPKLSGVPALAQASERILASLVAGHPVTDVPPELQRLYRPSVQPYLISWFEIDPRVEIAKVTARTVVIGGGADLQVPADDARALAAARPGAQLLIVDGMSHVLKDATGLSPQQQMTTVYVDPNLPVMPAVPDAIAALATAPQA